MINLKNYKKDPEINSVQYRIDRTSLLGNPFKNKSILDKKDVIKKYEKYFYKSLKNPNSKISKGINELLELGKKYDEVHLSCWCHPGMCHGDVIIEYLKSLKE